MNKEKVSNEKRNIDSLDIDPNPTATDWYRRRYEKGERHIDFL